MFLDKIWVRIKGELLTLKEDLSSRGEANETDKELLERLERRFFGSGSPAGVDEDASRRLDRLAKKINSLSEDRAGTDERGYGAAGSEQPLSLQDLEQALNELKGRKAQKSDEPSHTQPPANPRRLG